MSSATSASRAQDQRKKRAAPPDTNEGDTGKRKKPNTSEKSKDQPASAVRQTPVVLKEGPVVFHPLTLSSIIPAKITHPAPSKITNPTDPRPASSLSGSSARNRLTKQLYEQIPFLENDPLKALEMLKKMVQESGLETLYGSVNENTHRSRDFSERVVELKKNVENILKFMISGKASEQEKLEKYKEMKTIWSKIHGLNEAKVKLTQNAYDMVDRVIRRLDKELETIVDEIGDTKTDTAEAGPGATGGKQDGPLRRRDRDFDMPVDPNEPTYCECKQISFGEMIACDNVNCPIEWFHFTCVGLTSKPKGKWFCKRCVASGQNKQGKKKKPRMGIIEKYASASDKSEVEHLLSGSDESD